MSASSSVEDVSEGASYTGSFRHAQNSPEDGSSGDNDGTDMVGDIKQSDARLHNQNMELELEEWLAKHSATPEGSMDEKW